ncbi:10811_t:CDS:2, partial [Entrophospora sp. SA101]
MVFPDSISFPFHSLKITSSWLDPKTFKNYGEILANLIWQTHNIIKENKLPLEEPESLDEFYETSSSSRIPRLINNNGNNSNNDATTNFSSESYSPPSYQSADYDSLEYILPHNVDYLVGLGTEEFGLTDKSLMWIVDDNNISELCEKFRNYSIEHSKERLLTVYEELEYVDEKTWLKIFNEICSEFEYVDVSKAVWKIWKKIIN